MTRPPPALKRLPPWPAALASASAPACALACAVAWALAGCAVPAPHAAPAPLPAGTRFTANPIAAPPPAADGAAGQAQHLVPGVTPAQWWRALGSPALDALVDEALRASPTLAAADATLRQAHALHAAQAGNTLWPQVDLGLGAQRQQISPSSQGLPGDGREFGLYGASVGVRYRFDAGGGIDHSLRALAARAELRHHEFQAARHALAAAIATTAITRARLAAQIDAQTALLRAQDEGVRLANVRLRLGQAAPDEASALAAQAESTRAGLPALSKQRQQADHLLATLAGRPPAQGVPTFALADFRLPERLPVDIPAQWARRRPDIQAAEAAVRAADADWGAAVARQYPQITLNAGLGMQALSVSSLFGGPAAVWSLAGQLTQPLFNAGLPAERRAAQAGFDIAAAHYQRVVLDALRNVADALTAVDQDARALTALSRGVAAAEEQHRVTERQYRAGAASAVQLVVAEQLRLQARTALIAAQAQRLANTVALSAALAGGVDE